MTHEKSTQPSVSKSSALEFLRRLPKKIYRVAGLKHEDSSGRPAIEIYANLIRFEAQKIRSRWKMPQGRILIQHYS